jgi:hypothetical protein
VAGGYQGRRAEWPGVNRAECPGVPGCERLGAGGTVQEGLAALL